jgi:hypothetical protein
MHPKFQVRQENSRSIDRGGLLALNLLAACVSSLRETIGPHLFATLPLNARQLDARCPIHEAMQPLGGISSPAGSYVWRAVGLQCSVCEWAVRQGWGGRPVRQDK